MLHLSEHAVYGRIQAARIARRFPIVLQRLAGGDLTLTAVTLVGPHLTPENHMDVLRRSRHRSKREVEEIVASLRPSPDVRSIVRREPGPRRPRASPSPAVARLPEKVATVTPDTSASAAPTDAIHGPTGGEDRPLVARSPRSLMKPTAPERYTMRFTISRATFDKLRRVQDLMRHVMPDGDPAAVFDRALTRLLEDLEKRRLAATDRPRESAPVEPRGRHIPAAVRREGWTRDGGQCAFQGARGRCSETGFLEFHHLRPFAAGGEPTADNVGLRCRAHNQYEADLFFGPLIARERRANYSVQTDHGENAPH